MESTGVVSGLVSVAAIVPVLLAGAYRQYRGATTEMTEERAPRRLLTTTVVTVVSLSVALVAG